MCRDEQVTHCLTLTTPMVGLLKRQKKLIQVLRTQPWSTVDIPRCCLIGVDNFHCKSITDRLKIQTANFDSYRALVQFLRKENTEFHTYQLQEEKPIRVVIYNIHPTTACELIKKELVLRLFDVRQVTTVLHRLNKTPLPLFFVDLQPTSH
jgi:hypothetical protein